MTDAPDTPRTWSREELLELIDRAIAHPSERHDRERQRIAEAQAAQQRAAEAAVVAGRKAEASEYLRKYEEDQRRAAYWAKRRAQPNGTAQIEAGKK